MVKRRTAVIALGAAAAALTQTKFTPADIEKAEQAWVEAVKKNDFAALDRLLADDLVYTHSSGIVETKAEYLAKLKTGDQKYNSIEFSNMKARVYGNAGIMNASARMTGATKGVPFDNKLLIIHVWIYQKGMWQLAAHQTTRLQ